MKVCKFGGTSLADANQIRKVCNIIVSDGERRLVVVSAPGKRFDSDIKVTDMLIKCAKLAIAENNYNSNLDEVISRYAQIADDLGVPDIMNEISADFTKRLIKDTDNVKFMDRVISAGEDNCAKLVTAYLKSIGYDSNYIHPGQAGMLLSADFSNTVVLDQSYEKLAKLKNIKGIGVFPGFFGYSLKGDIVTFPRGGSDITGAILAASVKAEVYENFTDVDYVYSVNPKIIKNPKPITEITYREMRELSYAGFNVYQEDALLPVYKAGVPVNIKNVNNPTCPGTMIVKNRVHTNSPVIGVASDDKFCCIAINKYLMNREVGFGRRVLGIIEDEGLNFEHMPTGIDDISVILRESQLSDDAKDRLIEHITTELRADSINVEKNLCLIMVVGEGMSHNVGIAARATKALASVKVNIQMFTQGSSEVSMVFATSKADCEKALKALYEEFFEVRLGND